MLLHSLDKVLQVVGAALLSEPSERRVRSRGGRVLLWSWWMMSLVVTAAYSGSLTSFLSVSQQPQPFSAPEDLLTTDHTYTWGLFRNFTSSLLLQNSSHPVYRGVWSGIQRFSSTDPTVLGTNVTAMADKVRWEDFVLIEAHLTVLDMLGQDCNIIMKDAGMKTHLMSPNLPKGSALVKPLSDIVHHLQSSGVLSQWTDQWFPRTSCPAPQGPVVMTLLHVQGVLLVLPVGVGLALAVLLLEWAYFWNRVMVQDRRISRSDIGFCQTAGVK